MREPSDCLDDLVSLAKRKSEETAHDRKAKKSKKQFIKDSPGDSTSQHAERDDYPYPVVPDDHCESPEEAYRDISSFLHALAAQLGKTAETLSIFDPYFCEGAMKGRLHALGFHNVRNEKKDFYELIQTESIPQFDVLITNPPYSGDHMERLLKFCTSSLCGKPWFLLLPNYVYTKDYYSHIFSSNNARLPFYVAPAGTRRYLYTTPKGRRQEKSAKFTSPFPTLWYCQIYEHREKVLSLAASRRVKELQQHQQDGNVNGNSKLSNTAIVVALNSNSIPLEHAPDNDPRKKKLRNNMKRSKNKKRQKLGNNVNANATATK